MNVTISGQTATIQIGQTVRTARIIGWESELPVVEPVEVGVRVGASGQKIWYSTAVILAKAHVYGPTDTPYTLGHICPLNTVNRGLVASKIVTF